MKLLMLGWEFPPHNSGGLGVACYHMAKALAARGADIDFVLPYKAAKQSHPTWLRMHHVSDMRPEERTTSLLAYSRSVDDIRKIQVSYVAYVKQLLQDYTPDVVHAHDWLTMEAGMVAKRMSGAPLVVHVHATEFDRCGSSRGNAIVHEIEYNGLMMADRIIAVSQLTKSIIVQKYNIPADKIEVVHNAVDVDELSGYDYDSATYRYIEMLRDEGNTIVMTLTRLTVQKGLTHLLRATAKALDRYDRLVLVIAGDGEQRDELIQLAADLGIADKVIFTGFVRGKQWRDAYQVADIFVMSSVSEPFGITALEAAHHNNALIITKQSGASEVLHSSLQYDFWDLDRLADQMVGIALSPALSWSLRTNVKHEYNRLSWQTVADRCLQTYRSVRQGARV
jgi:glycogen(starch) synthase